MVSGRAKRHAAIAGIAIATGIFLELLKNAPAPRRGNPIRELLYDVTLERLENESHLANSFLKSQPDAELAAFLAESAAATNSTLGRMRALAKRRLFWGLQRWLGLSRTDASGLLSMATLYVGSHQQFKALVNGTAASLVVLREVWRRVRNWRRRRALPSRVRGEQRRATRVGVELGRFLGDASERDEHERDPLVAVEGAAAGVDSE